MTKQPSMQEQLDALNRKFEEATRVELDAVEARRVAGEISDSEAEALHDEVIRRKHEEAAPFYAPFAAWRRRRDFIMKTQIVASLLLSVTACVLLLLKMFERLK